MSRTQDSGFAWNRWRNGVLVAGAERDVMSTGRLTPEQLRSWPKGKSLLALTAYDYPLARVLDEAGVDLIHVGDSLGMVVLGMADTTGVTMADMVRATEAVARGRTRAMISADLPIGSYETAEACVENSKLLLRAGADAVKPEGGKESQPQWKALQQAKIPWIGHLGMLPQKVLEEGGYKRKGKTVEEVQRMKADAQAMERAGACAIVLELVTAEAAAEVTAALQIPTIGIGAGKGTTGQIRVSYDLLGLTPWNRPGFVKEDLGFARQITEMVQGIRKGGRGELG